MVFLIALSDGNSHTYSRNEYIPDLQTSLDKLAGEISASLNDADDTRFRRKLTISVDQSVVNGVISENCPDTEPSNDRCEEVSASVGMYVTTDDPEASKEQMEEAADTAVDDGRLQEILDSINSETPVRILSNSTINGEDPVNRGSNTDGGGSQSLRARPIVGFVAVGLLAILLISMFLARRNKRSTENEAYVKPPYELADEDNLALKPEEGELHVVDTGANGESNIVSSSSSPVSSQDSSYATAGSGGVTRITAAAIETGQAGSSTRYMDQDSTSTGSSGWSSHDGLSSVDESSHTSDDVENLLRSVDARRGATQARILTATSLPSEYSNRDIGNNSSRDADGDEIASSFSDLDQAIHRGDWAAVGITAALLASRSTESMSSGGQLIIHAAHRAAKRDRLVAAGDWEADVNAAARFDSEESPVAMASSPVTHGLQSTMSVGPGPVADSTESGTLLSTSFTRKSIAGNTPGTNGSRDSKVNRRLEYRAKIESLVNRIMPEEAVSIDEMMVQFRGREDKLVETLQTMRERQVAKRAARTTVEDKTDPIIASSLRSSAVAITSGTGSSPPAFVSVDGQDDEKPVASKNPNTQGKVSNNLLSVTESGGWDQVTVAGVQIEDQDDLNSENASFSTDSSTIETGAAGDAGGWANVVNAPSRQTTVDNNKNNNEEKKARHLKRLLEEEEALAQADIWTAIAEQTKNDAAVNENTGAGDAADWAIARILNALVQVRDSGQIQDSSQRGGTCPTKSPKQGDKEGEV